jgi:hypothetical protein
MGRTREYYSDPQIGMYGLCANDNTGDLFVDGTGSSTNALAELPKGSESFIKGTKLFVRPANATF